MTEPLRTAPGAGGVGTATGGSAGSSVGALAGGGSGGALSGSGAADAGGKVGASGGAGGEPPALSPRRHLILMVGDGMQLAHEIVASRYLTGTDRGLTFHAFDHQAFVTTWDITSYDSTAARRGAAPYTAAEFDPYIGYDPSLGGWAPYPLLDDTAERFAYFASTAASNSASTATAMATGEKTLSGRIGWGPSAADEGRLTTVVELVKAQYGMATGFVTTVPLSHATPAGWFAHNPSRGAYVDIAREMFEVTRPEVLIGGGNAAADGLYLSYADVSALEQRGDYVVVKRAAGVDGAAAVLAGAIRAKQEKKKLCGLFGDATGELTPPVAAEGSGAPAVTRGSLEDPTLGDAAVAALEVLAQDPDGLFLLIEQGSIDLANHANDCDRMLGCVIDLELAVQQVVAFVDREGDELDWTNTTLIVTADHATGFFRLHSTLGRGALPGAADYTYHSSGHTNELVGLYARGAAASRVAELTTAYPHLDIMDDTAIFTLSMDALAR